MGGGEREVRQKQQAINQVRTAETLSILNAHLKCSSRVLLEACCAGRYPLSPCRPPGHPHVSRGLPMCSDTDRMSSSPSAAPASQDSTITSPDLFTPSHLKYLAVSRVSRESRV